jgi:hypothetical protein
MKKDFVNPIDKDKITETPHNLTFGHHVGSAVVKPEDMGKVKGRALTAMEFQTDLQLSQLYEQMQLLADQAKKINKRKEISERIYGSVFKFEPIINHIYYLYEKENKEQVLSILSPSDWSNSSRNQPVFLAKMRLLGDHTWDILEYADELEDE